MIIMIKFEWWHSLNWRTIRQIRLGINIKILSSLLWMMKRLCYNILQLPIGYVFIVYWSLLKGIFNISTFTFDNIQRIFRICWNPIIGIWSFLCSKPFCSCFCYCLGFWFFRTIKDWNWRGAIRRKFRKRLLLYFFVSFMNHPFLITDLIGYSLSIGISNNLFSLKNLSQWFGLM